MWKLSFTYLILECGYDVNTIDSEPCYWVLLYMLEMCNNTLFTVNEAEFGVLYVSVCIVVDIISSGLHVIIIDQPQYRAMLLVWVRFI